MVRGGIDPPTSGFSDGVGAVVLRRQRDWLLLLTGVAVLTLALFGVRALH